MISASLYSGQEVLVERVQFSVPLALQMFDRLLTIVPVLSTVIEHEIFVEILPLFGLFDLGEWHSLDHAVGSDWLIMPRDLEGIQGKHRVTIAQWLCVFFAYHDVH